MVASYLYALNGIQPIDVVCRELAIKIVANEAREFKVGLMIVGDEGSCLVVNIEPLNVSVVRKFREAGEKARESFSFKRKASTSSAGFLQKSKDLAQQNSLEFNHLLAYIDEKSVLKFPENEEVELGNPSVSRQVKKKVKHVKVFDGDFTIGDPTNPLLRFPIEMYPASRKAKPQDVATYADDRKVVQSSTFKTEDGQSVDAGSIEKGFLYLNELVTVDADLERMMNGEFDGAEEWPKAFELLATVPEVPPWMLMERTDYVIGKDERAQMFLDSFSIALKEAKMNALVRLCKEPRIGKNGTKNKKGALALVVLHCGNNNDLLCSQLPFKEDFKSYYKFADLPTKPYDNEEQLDEQMDELVDSMTVEGLPTPVANPVIKRIDEFLIHMISKGDAPTEADLNKVDEASKECGVFFSESLANSAKAKRIGAQLMKEFGIVEQNKLGNDKDSGAQVDGQAGETQEMEFEFIS